MAGVSPSPTFGSDAELDLLDAHEVAPRSAGVFGTSLAKLAAVVGVALMAFAAGRHSNAVQVSDVGSSRVEDVVELAKNRRKKRKLVISGEPLVYYKPHPMRFDPTPRVEYECKSQQPGIPDSWCHNEAGTATCDNNYGTVWGCQDECDCEGLPECEGVPPPASGQIPCICTASGGSPTPPPTTPPTSPTPTRRRRSRRRATPAPTTPPPTRRRRSRRRRSPEPPNPTPAPPVPPPPSADVSLGGWCASAYGNKCGLVWPEDDIDIILPGGFQSDPSVLPGKGNWDNGIPLRFLTMGGAGVGSPGQSPCLDADWLEKQASNLGVTGIAYDIEGCYHGMHDDSKLKSVVKKIKQLNPALKHMIVPLGDGTTFDDDGTFDYLAPMLYWGDTTYQTNSWSTVDRWRKNWVTAGWDPAKTFLTYQGHSAYHDTHGHDVLMNLGKTAKSDGYKGVLGWFSSKNENVANLKTIRDGMAS